MDNIAIMIVDNHRLMLDGIKSILDDVTEFEVIAAVQDGIAAMEQLKNQKLDVVLIDVQLPGQSGLETCRQITRKYPLIQVIMLTNDLNDLYLFESIRAGAKGYLRKSICSQELMKAIYTVYRKGAILPLSAVQQALHRTDCPYRRDVEPWQELTLKEREILLLIVEGQTTNQTAEFLCISPKTVRNHLSHIYKRLGTKDRLQTILYMSQNVQKLLPLDA
jgi:DNA-binding NarL/FixJ family response regulator